MVMTRKDYKLIADSLNKQAEFTYNWDSSSNMTKWIRATQIVSIRDNLAWELCATNPNYDKNKFFEATKTVDEIERKLYEEE